MFTSGLVCIGSGTLCTAGGSRFQLRERFNCSQGRHNSNFLCRGLLVWVTYSGGGVSSLWICTEFSFQKPPQSYPKSDYHTVHVSTWSCIGCSETLQTPYYTLNMYKQCTLSCETETTAEHALFTFSIWFQVTLILVSIKHTHTLKGWANSHHIHYTCMYNAQTERSYHGKHILNPLF